jgi:class 3 adenylate cyclase/pimeloyl-ACP methyl ester carboxylesterase
MQVPQTRYATRPDGLSIAYQVFGEGPADLLVAPALVSHLDLAWTDPDLTRLFSRLARFARVIVYDKPGTGLSDPVAHVPTLEERRDDILVVLDAAASERASLLGFSEGGVASLLLAATYPERVRSLVLYGAFAFGTNAVEGLDDPAAIAAQQQLDAAYRDVEGNWGQGKVIDYYAPSVANRLMRSSWAIFERAAASPAMIKGVLEAARRMDARSALGAVRVPTLVLHHQDDIMPVFHAHILAEGIPGAQLRILPGRDHMFWVSDFEESVSEIERFVAGPGGSGSPERMLATVLFVDIARSTERAVELGDSAWRQLLERLNRVFGEEVVGHGGRVVRSLGDGVLAVFDGPARAIRCAEAIRAALATLDISVRTGVHTGECDLMGDGIGGLAVHIGARVGALAGPGEILVSRTVTDLVVGSGLRFTNRGDHALKGVPGEWTLYAVGDALDQDARLPGGESIERDLRLSDRFAVRLARRAPGVLRAASKLARTPATHRT